MTRVKNWAATWGILANMVMLVATLLGGIWFVFSEHSKLMSHDKWISENQIMVASVSKSNQWIDDNKGPVSAIPSINRWVEDNKAIVAQIPAIQSCIVAQTNQFKELNDNLKAWSKDFTDHIRNQKK